MSKTTLSISDLKQFTGTEQWHRHALNRSILYTDGAQYLAEKAGAYWLLDEIALAQKSVQALAAETFQLWRLTVESNHSATLMCDDGNGNVLHRKHIPFTDFPLPEISLYCCDNVILLPSEY